MFGPNVPPRALMPPRTGRRLPSRGLSATTPPPEDEDESLSMPPSEPFVDPLDEEGPLKLPDPVPGVAPVKVVEPEQAARRHRAHAPLDPKVQIAVGACVVL